MQFSNLQLEFLARLARSPDGQLLLQILQAKQAERDAGLRTASGEEVFRKQGRAVEISELIADITEAERRLTRSIPSVTSRTQVVA